MAAGPRCQAGGTRREHVRRSIEITTVHPVTRQWRVAAHVEGFCLVSITALPQHPPG
jgi:hypothetical protein